MDQPLLVRGVEGGGDLLNYRNGALRLERPGRFDDVLKVTAFDEAHGEVREFTGLTGPVNRNDVGMLE